MRHLLKRSIQLSFLCLLGSCASVQDTAEPGARCELTPDQLDTIRANALAYLLSEWPMLDAQCESVSDRVRVAGATECSIAGGPITTGAACEPSPHAGYEVVFIEETLEPVKIYWIDEQVDATSAPSTPAISLGNGTTNWIVTDGVTRNGATFTFAEVQIDGNGWLVMHPFKDGKPVGEVYVGSTYIEDGTSSNVEITVDESPAPGTMFIVMLHRDVNENQAFDFVFVDDRHVLDKAVFEGTTMIAHAIAAP